MKRIVLYCCFLLSSFYCFSQPDVNQLHETARTFMRQRDFANAILVLNRAIPQDPSNLSLSKDLAISYYYQKENKKALETIEPLLDRAEADDQCFQIAGNIYKELDMLKECEKLYKKGIKQFPNSGPLYNEYGELLWVENNKDAIQQWEMGIKADPSYSRNYFNAAKYYSNTKDKIWCLLYGESFVNIEPNGKNSIEIKEILLAGYKKLFADADLEQNINNRTDFEKAFLQTMNRQSAVAAQGINTESLTMIRTRFIIDWARNNKPKFTYKLFDYQQQLLQEGMFEAYNQWLFGSSENLPAFQNWTNIHKEDYMSFINFQKDRLYKVPAGQYYK